MKGFQKAVCVTALAVLTLTATYVLQLMGLNYAEAQTYAGLGTFAMFIIVMRILAYFNKINNFNEHVLMTWAFIGVFWAMQPIIAAP